MKIIYRFIHDASLKEWYLISPFKGDLYICPSKEVLKLARRLKQRGHLLGNYCRRCVAKKEEATVIVNSSKGGNLLAFRLLAKFPLYFAIALVQGFALFRRCFKRQKRSIKSIHHALSSSSLDSQSETDCLPKSLRNLYILVSNNFCCTLVIGIYVPTNGMHAWVEVDGNVLGENPDELLHFQPAVCYIM